MSTWIALQDRNQTLRIKRSLMGLVCYAIMMFYLIMARNAGYFNISVPHILILLLFSLCIHLVYLSVINSGWNLRFKDPSMTMIQMVIANTCVSYLMLFTDTARGPTMIFYIGTNLFGIFQLNLKEFLVVTFLPLLQYGGMILWFIGFSKGSYDPRQDAVQWVVLVCCLTWLCYMGTTIKNIRRKVKQTEEKLLQSNEEISRQTDELQKSRDELEKTHKEIEQTQQQMKYFNRRIMESIDYAKIIQQSLLPAIDMLKTNIPKSFFIWKPKNILGGDIFFTHNHPSGFTIALMDCTGEGVPGAFMTMIAYTEARKIIVDEACQDPAEILKRLNHSVQAILKKDFNDSMSDQGMDAAVCRVDSIGKTVTFAGANMPLFYNQEGALHLLKGDDQSLGFIHSDKHFCFTNHTIPVHERSSFYLTSDGYLNQVGGAEKRSIGLDGFEHLLMECSNKPFDEQRKEILQAILSHQGEHEQTDDVTVIGFGI